MRYWPNPAHERGTTEAGPPRWWPDKEPCPDDLTIDERNDLPGTSLPLDPADAHSRRFNVRRCVRGLELYEAKWTRDVDGEPEFHGHPTTFAVRDGGSPSAVTLQTPRTARPWGQRFEAARAVGHLLLDPVRSGCLGAASGPFGQETRHRRSGAFAAELLLPETAIARASGDRLDGAADPVVFERLMQQHGIGARAAAYQMWNRGWLSSPDVRDELIDRFARAEG